MQQPPNPYPQYPQQQWQPPPMPPQQYQQPPQYQSLMPPSPKKKSRKRLWFILAAAVLVLAVIIAVASLGKSPQPAAQGTQPAHATHQPAQQPTTVPTTKPTPKPTVQATQGLVATHGTPHLGGPISDFIGAYGQPDPHSSLQPGLYDLHFLPSTSSNSNVDGLIISTDTTNAYLAANILVQAQNGGGFPIGDAKVRCMTFAPLDAHFVKEFVYADNTGFDMVYTSVELAKDFPASAFTDSQGNQVQAGSFDIQYLYSGDNQHIDSCDVVIGEQQTTN